MKTGSLVGQAFDLKVGDRCTANVGDTHPECQRVDEISNYDILAMDSFVLGKPFVRMKWVMIHGDHAEEMVVRFRNGLAWPVPVDITDLEFLEVAAEWAVVDAHGSSVEDRDHWERCHRRELATLGCNCSL